MSLPVAWTIAGSDPSGGAGIQADLKTMHSLGVYGCSVLTALTAQNTMQVYQVESPSAPMVARQLQALREDLPPVAVKIGMVGSQAVLDQVIEGLDSLEAFVLYDPVMVSTTGDSLMAPDLRESLIARLLRRMDLLTPNLAEAELLLNRRIETTVDMEHAAFDLLHFGVGSVLIKGGHAQGPWSQDFWTNGQERFWLTSPRQNTRHHHGTGCTLSSAIVACKALGYSDTDALVIAKAYVNQGLAQAPGLGQGHGPLAHGGWPLNQAYLPWLTLTAEAGQARPQFADCGPQPLGFYPIVDRAAWLEKLLPLGVSTVQLRIKDLSGEALAQEVQHAVRMAKQYDCRLFINDYWELALAHQAYGVHLGQEDLATADIQVMAQAGIRLGVSTHCYAEVAWALAVRPSYIAIGPVFETTTKPMAFAPQGLQALKRWRQTLDYPLVAIGGMFLENAPDVLAAGVDGIAVVRDIAQAKDLSTRVMLWQRLFDVKHPVLET